METKKAKKRGTTVVKFIKGEIESCITARHYGTAANYRHTLNSFLRFMEGRDIPFSRITERLVMEYEQWLARKVTRNSSSFYLRNLRALYNRAVKYGIVQQCFPFRDSYTGVDRTRKRAVNERMIARLLRLDLSFSRSLALARDLFVFSYCTRGMAFVDIAFLRKSDISGDTLSYIRRKTGQRLCVHIEPCIARIIRRYEEETRAGIYVFPLLTSSEPAEAYRQYQVALGYHNRKLKQLAREIGEDIPLSSYTARHTWATAARKHNVPLAVISEGMGHTSERTTQIYLASLDNAEIDKANKELVKSLNCIVSL